MMVARLLGVILVSAFISLFLPNSASAEDYDSALSKIALDFHAKLEGNGQRSTTVLDFTNLDGSTTDLGRLLTTEFSTKLVSLGGTVSVVDRQNLQFLLKEHNLSVDGLIDPRTRRELGNLIGIDAIIAGTLVAVGKEIRLNLRAVGVETGRILAADSVSISLSPALEELSGRSISSRSGDSQKSSPSEPPKEATNSQEAPAAPPPPAPPPSGKRLTSDLLVELASIADKRGGLGGGMVATFVFHNTSNKSLAIALASSRDAFCADFRLTDGAGGFCRACANGEVLSTLNTARPLLFGGFPANQFSPIGPLSTEQHTLKFYDFRCQSQIGNLSNLALGGSFLILDGKQIYQAPISFSGIRAIGN